MTDTNAWFGGWLAAVRDKCSTLSVWTLSVKTEASAWRHFIWHANQQAFDPFDVNAALESWLQKATVDADSASTDPDWCEGNKAGAEWDWISARWDPEAGEEHQGPTWHVPVPGHGGRGSGEHNQQIFYLFVCQDESLSRRHHQLFGTWQLRTECMATTWLNSPTITHFLTFSCWPWVIIHETDPWKTGMQLGVD